MAQSNEESEASTLPHPALNPLLNPILAANMGRWAEVYFTSPPDKREEAVTALIRELGENSRPEQFPTHTNLSAQTSRHDKFQPQKPELGKSGPDLGYESSFPVCHSCGHKNGLSQRFCGMCGNPLSDSFASGAKEDAFETAAKTWQDAEEHVSLIPDEIPSGPVPELIGEFQVAETQDRSESSAKESVESVAHFGTFFGEVPRNNPSSDYQLEDPVFGDRPPIDRSFRIFIGAMLALLLALFIYLTWRGASALKGNPLTHAAKALESTGPNTAPTRSPKTHPSEPALPVPDESGGSGIQTASSIKSSARHAESRSLPRDGRLRGATSLPKAGASAPNSAGQSGGAQELATAETYLNGSTGSMRDSSQAATWLWKAVRKENLAATVMLSDLYLHGDGVAKNCDQAKILLRSAVREGSAAAAERLRNLQAFDCQ